MVRRTSRLGCTPATRREIQPVILKGDELTGNLDSETALRMFGLLRQVNERGMTVLYVTHDAGLAARADRMITIRDGQIADDA